MGNTSRRAFLTKLGLATGAVFPAMTALGQLRPAPLQPIPTSNPDNKPSKKIVILGAGLAGLTAAFELTNLGYQCTILEARSKAGGRALTIRNGDRIEEVSNGTQVAAFDEGLYFNAGPSRIPHSHAIVLHYCKQFNIPLEVYNNVNEAAYFFSEGSGTLANKKIKKGSLHNDMRGHTSELLAKAFNSSELDLPLTKEDGEKLLEYLRAEGALNIDNVYKGSSRRGFMELPGYGNKVGKVADPFVLSEIVSSGLLGSDFYGVAEYVHELQQTMLQMVGGNDALAMAFSKRLAGSIKLNSIVQEIQNTDNGVTIYYQDASGTRQIQADYCISTIPLPVLSDIHHNFDSHYSRAIDKTAYILAGKIGLQFKRRFWEEDENIYGGITHTNNDIYQLFYPSNDYLSKKGLLIGYYNFNDRAKKVGNLSYKEREQLAYDKGLLIHPQYAQEYDKKSFSVSWHKTKYALGGWAIYAEKERETIYQTLLRPDKCTYFAGENVSHLNGWMAGALDAARNVVNMIHTRVTG